MDFDSRTRPRRKLLLLQMILDAKPIFIIEVPLSWPEEQCRQLKISISLILPEYNILIIRHFVDELKFSIAK